MSIFKGTKGSTERLRANLVSGVTKDNYASLASAFIGQNEGGFVIALRPMKKQGEDFSASVKQFGAWHSWLKSLGYQTKLMDDRGYYTVPAEWPHLFSTEATVQVDMRVGEQFEREWRASEAQQRAPKIAIPNRIPWPDRKPSVPDTHLDPMSYELEQAVLASYDEYERNKRPPPEEKAA